MSASTPKPKEEEDLPRLVGLATQRVEGLPPAAYYIPDFITEEEEQYLLRKIEATPQPKWKTVGSGRRLQYWGGTLSKNNVLLPENMPDWLSSFPDIVERIDSFLDLVAHFGTEGETKRVLGINQVLINEYQPGQGIAPHEDGGAFLPLVSTLSLGSSTVLDLHHYISPTTPSPPMIPTEDNSSGGRTIAAVPLGHVLLMPRSLFILSGSLYSGHLHGISEREEDWVVKDAAAVAAGSAETKGAMDVGDGPVPPTAPPVVVANAPLLPPNVQADIASPGGWRKQRGTRTSLTFRRAAKVLKGGALGFGASGLLRRK